MINRLNIQQGPFWDNLTILSACHLGFTTPTNSIATLVNTSNAFMDQSLFVVPSAGLTVSTNRFHDVFSITDPSGLKMISRSRQLGLAWLPRSPENRKKLALFSKAFEEGQFGSDVKAPSVAKPDLCPCCSQAAKMRVHFGLPNPIASILTFCSRSGIELTVTTGNTEGSLTISHLPETLEIKNDHLISVDSRSRIDIDFSHLHAICLGQDFLEANAQQTITLFDSLGVPTLRFHADLSQVDGRWQKILQRQNYGYQILFQTR